MAIRIGPPSFSGNGGAVKVGRRAFSYPPGSRVEYADDRRMLFILTPRAGYAWPWTLHIVHEAGEVVGVPAKIQLKIRREVFPGT